MNKQYLISEIAMEVAWQVGDDPLPRKSRATNRHYLCDLVQRIVKEGIITEDSEDIDEIIDAWLIKNGEAND
jgi:hypothetical protein